MSMVKTAAAVALVLAGLLAVGLTGLLSGFAAEKNEPPTQAGPPRPAPGTSEPLPAGALLWLGRTELRHGHQVQQVVFAPDGKTFASADWDHLARLWDADTGKEVRVFGEFQDRRDPYSTSRWVSSLAFSPNGKLLATGEHADGWPATTLRVWEVATGKKLQELKGHQKGVLSLAFSPDGKLLASGSADDTVRLWDLAGGAELAVLTTGTKGVRGVGFLDNGRLLVTHGFDGQARFWKAPRNGLGEPDGESLSDIEAFACAPDGHLVALGDARGNVRLWNGVAHKELQQWTLADGPVRCLNFSPDSKMLAAGGDDAIVKLWEIAGGKEVGNFADQGGPLKAVAVGPAGKRLASVQRQDNSIRLWDVAARRELVPRHGHQGVVRPLRFADDGKVLMSSARDRALLRWDAATGKLLTTLHGQHISDHAAAFTPDGKSAAWGGYDGLVHVLDWQTGKEVQQFQGMTSDIRALAFAADGKLLAALAGDGTLVIWNTATGKEIQRVQMENEDKDALLLFAPDGKRLLWLSGKFGGRLLDVAAGQWSELPPASRGLSAAFAPNGELLAIGNSVGVVQLWDVNGRRLLRSLEKHPGYVMALAFSPDGRTLAAGSWKSIRLWEMASGQERGRFEEVEGDVYSLAFSPNGRILASGCGDSTIPCWDLTGRSGKPPATLTAEQRDRLWTHLTGEDASQAGRALGTLASVPDQALPLLHKALVPAAKLDTQRVDQLIQDLDSDLFTVREKATEELQKLGPVVAGSLRRVLAASPSAEVRLRVRRLLDKIDVGEVSSDRLGMLRRLELLEQIGTPDARHLLAKLAQGEPAAELTQEAKRALERLTHR
jgi:WD40 repeat protein